MDVYEHREILERVNAAEEQLPGNGPTVALLEAILEQNQMLGDLVEHTESIKNELDYIRLAVGGLIIAAGVVIALISFSGCG